MCRSGITRSHLSTFLFSVLLLSLFHCHGCVQIVCQNAACNRTTVTEPGVVNKPYELSVSKNTEYILEFLNPANVSNTSPARITVESNDATSLHPLLIVLRQAKGVLSWQIPFAVGNTNYTKTSRTLCPDSSHYQWWTFSTISRRFEMENNNSFYVNLYTGSIENLTVNLIVTTVKNFTVMLGEEHIVPPSNNSVEFTPSEPHYYQFLWPRNNTRLVNHNVSSVLLKVESKSETCMTMSIQKISCPVLDLERTVGYEGYRQTIDKKGGVTLTYEELTAQSKEFETGFYVVFVVNGDDNKCVDKSFTESSLVYRRHKSLTFLISETIGTDMYIVAIMAPLVVIASLYVLFFIGAVVCTFRPLPESNSLIAASRSSQELPSPAEEPSTSYDVENASGPSCATAPDNVSRDEIDFDTLDDIQNTKQVLRDKRYLHVCDLARKDARILRRKSDLYVMNLATVAVFYSLPVFQLMLSYQTMLQKTGNQDQCYYNFLCAHPFGLNFLNISLSDFNHVFSNIGYVLLGLLFILWTSRRDAMHGSAVHRRPELDKLYGIPQHYGMFYALGLALIMEGVLSGLYHICPNKTNFQFDTSFMYVIATLCMVKLYQNRHPDVNASAYSTFMLLALIIFVGMIGILEDSDTFFIIFSVIHLAMCLWVSIQVYHMGLVTFRNIMNWVLVYLAVQLKLKSNFGSYLLTVLLTNLMLYFLFYILMKLLNREKVVLEPLLYFLGACALWFSSMVFFILFRVTSWTSTPAGSRQRNENCILLDFYDSHDIWHFLSAGGMFCTFMVLLTLDDDLVDVPRTMIPVF